MVNVVNYNNIFQTCVDFTVVSGAPILFPRSNFDTSKIMP